MLKMLSLECSRQLGLKHGRLMIMVKVFETEVVARNWICILSCIKFSHISHFLEN
jgi:hypothetical protein